jgi:hypothetical protein
MNKESGMSTLTSAWTLAIAMFAVPLVSHTEAQVIASALLPLPEVLRAEAAVVQLDDAGLPRLLRKGTNAMVCMADKPGDDEFDVRCYNKDFIPVVYRNFQLRSREKVGAEINAGKLKFSTKPTAGYRCLGPASAYDSSTNQVTADIECWQSIHFPFQTSREIGLPDEADIPENLHRSVPYVMSSGKYWSHVMIRHPKEK